MVMRWSMMNWPLNDGNDDVGDEVDDDDGVKELRHLLLKPLN